jgi:hypothetical protein
MIQNKKLILTALLAITCCGNEAFGMGREVDGPPTVGSRLGGGSVASSQARTAPTDTFDRRWDVIDFNETGNAVLIGSVKLNDTWRACEMFSSSTHKVNEYIDESTRKPSQVTRIPFSPQVLERPEFACWREDILNASKAAKRTYSSSSNYSRSSSSTTTINGRVVGQGGRKTSTSSSKAKVIKCSDEHSVVSYEKSSETRGPGHNGQATGSSGKSVIRTENVPQYLSTLGVQPSDVLWETSPQASRVVAGTPDVQSFLRDFSALMGNATPILSPRAPAPARPAVRNTPSRPASAPAKPAVRNAPLRPNVTAPAPLPQVGRRVEALKPSAPVRAVSQPARMQRPVTAPSVARRMGVPPSREAGVIPVRIANWTSQSARRAAPSPLTRPTSALARPQLRQPAPVALTRRVSAVPQRKFVVPTSRQAPARSAGLRPAVRTPAVGTRPNNSRLPSRR